jgi:hypothetical protein
MAALFILGFKKAEDCINNWERFQFCTNLIIASAGGSKVRATAGLKVLAIAWLPESQFMEAQFMEAQFMGEPPSRTPAACNQAV